MWGDDAGWDARRGGALARLVDDLGDRRQLLPVRQVALDRGLVLREQLVRRVGPRRLDGVRRHPYPRLLAARARERLGDRDGALRLLTVRLVPPVAGQLLGPKLVEDGAAREHGGRAAREGLEHRETVPVGSGAREEGMSVVRVREGVGWASGGRRTSQRWST